MAFATIDDLTARFPRALTAAEAEQAETLLKDASFLLSIEAPGVVAAVDGDDEEIAYAAKLLTVAMVKRALLAQAAQQTINPAVEQISQAYGPYSSSVRYRSGGANLYLYDDELEYLLALLRGDNATAVSMRSPGL